MFFTLVVILLNPLSIFNLFFFIFCLLYRLNRFRQNIYRACGFFLLRSWIEIFFVCVCVVWGEEAHTFFKISLDFFDFFSPRIFPALLPLVNYKFKFNQPSGESGVTQFREIAKGCAV